MGTIQERKKSKSGKISFTATVRMNGQTITKTFDTRTEARFWMNETELDIRKGKHINLDLNKRTLNELIDRYIQYELPKRKKHDIQKYTMQLTWWKEHIGNLLLVNITPAVLSECKEKLITEKSTKPQNGRITRTPATANRYMACLSGVFTIATNEWQWMDQNPMRKIRKFKENKERDRILSADEAAKILEACKNFDLKGDNYNRETYLFVLIALSTGARYSEILKLQWDNVNLNRKMFYFLRTKNGRNRGVPMTEDVYTELEAFSKMRNIKSNYLFATKDGNKLIDMRTRFYKVLELSGVKDFRFHDIRHTVASYIAMNGGDILEIAQVTGHRSMQMVKRYSHYTEDHPREILQTSHNQLLSKVKKNI